MDDVTREHWRPVVGFEDFYKVSDWGRVRSLPRRGGNNRLYGGRILKPRPVNKWGHLAVHLHMNDVGKQCLIHRLVMASFVGPCPEGQEVCHWDGDPANNHLSNLRYATRQENMLDVLRYGTHHNTAKTHCKYGHEYTPENTRIGSHGDRNCLTCARERGYATWKRRQARMRSDPEFFAQECAKVAERARQRRARKRTTGG